MRIQNINFFKNYPKQYNIKSQNYLCSVHNYLDSDVVSFSGRPAQISNLITAQKEADKIQQESLDMITSSEEFLIDAYDALDETKQDFINALKYIDMARKALSQDITSVQLNNGNRLDFFSIMKKGKLLPVGIKIYDENGINVQNINVKDYVPSVISKFNSDETMSLAQFTSDSIIISDEIPQSNDTIGTSYVFTNGKLVSVRKNRNLNVRPYMDEKTYFYNEDGSLWLSEVDTQMHVDGKREVGKRYNFSNGQLINYYSEFTKFPDALLSWDESYHYDNQKFIGTSQNALQYASGKPVIAEKAIYHNGRKFVEAENVNCIISDFAPVLFLEK